MKSKKEMELLIKQNKNIIYKLARNLKIKIEDYEDVIYEGYLGLIEAVNKYDEKKKVKFSTYAYELIYFKMLDYLYMNEQYVTLNKYFTGYKIKIKKLYNEYKNIYRNNYDIINKICEELNITEFELNNLVNSKFVISFDEYTNEDNVNFETVELINKISYEDKNEYLESLFDETLINMLMSFNISKRNAKIFVLIYFYDITPKEISKYLHCSDSNIRNIIYKIIKIIRNNNDLKEFINEYINSKNAKIVMVKHNN